MPNYLSTTEFAGRFPEFTIDSSSTPSTTHLGNYIADIEAEVDAIVRSIGITAPVTNASALAYLKGVTRDGVAALYLHAKLADIAEPDNKRAAFYQRRYENALKEIKANPQIVRAADRISAEFSGDGVGQGNDTTNFDNDAGDSDPLFDRDYTY